MNETLSMRVSLTSSGKCSTPDVRLSVSINIATISQVQDKYFSDIAMRRYVVRCFGMPLEIHMSKKNSNGLIAC